ncbi:hypothetical protein [Clostridium mediterraneense]|uniref:hypothetical protein n=1 Tax=Clostridium mediterraneense TaxID=1805472 RepID=UPI000836D478|nr:hypothetical protein [Clostridium mediterraneense]
MKSITRNLIEYIGISEYLPTDIESFKQVYIKNDITLNENKADIDSISKIIAKAKILNTRIIKTPKGISLDGYKLTGYKLLVEGSIYYKIQYINLGENQSLNLADVDTRFLAFVIMPENFILGDNFSSSIFIEDINAEILSKRKISINTSLLIISE